MLAADDVGAAGVAADELSKLADDIDAPLLHAMAAYASGSVLLANGDASAALGILRRRVHRVARARDALRGGARPGPHGNFALRALGDDDTAAVELDAARATFERLGARPDLAAIAAPGRAAGPARPCPAC